jgi:hypothetical protein
MLHSNAPAIKLGRYQTLMIRSYVHTFYGQRVAGGPVAKLLSGKRIFAPLSA